MCFNKKKKIFRKFSLDNLKKKVKLRTDKTDKEESWRFTLCIKIFFFFFILVVFKRDENEEKTG